MPDTHLQRARLAVAPGTQKEAERAAALPQTDVFEWSEFVDGGNDDDYSGNPPPRPAPFECVTPEVSARRCDGKRKDTDSSPTRPSSRR